MDDKQTQNLRKIITRRGKITERILFIVEVIALCNEYTVIHHYSKCISYLFTY